MVKTKSYYGELFDVCAGKHGGNEQSVDAFESVKGGMRVAHIAILKFLELRGDHGATAQEYADRLGVPINKVSGRFSELKLMGRIEKTGVRNRGGVFVVKGGVE
jgi:hypothetical protein